MSRKGEMFAGLTVALVTPFRNGAVDEAALRIRRIAEDARVPLVENRPLARALYAETEIGQTIPEKYYQAIAAVLAHVYALSDKGRRYARAAGAEDLA